MSAPRLLVACVGNIFFGDDAFGVEVARRLAGRALPEGVTVIDFGIRGFDLAYALTSDYDGCILVDAVARGETPGTLFVIEPVLPGEGEPVAVEIDTHAMHPDRVLRLARTLGNLCPWIRIVGCEPAHLGSEADPAMGLSEPVTRAVSEALPMIDDLITSFRTARES